MFDAANPSTLSPPNRSCGYARLVGEGGVDHLVRKTGPTVLGRRSKAGGADVELGDSAAISRHHAEISYDFSARCWRLTVRGKNGAALDGAPLKPDSPPARLRSQARIELGGMSLWFLAPKGTAAAEALETEGQAPPAEAAVGAAATAAVAEAAAAAAAAAAVAAAVEAVKPEPLGASLASASHPPSVTAAAGWSPQQQQEQQEQQQQAEQQQQQQQQQQHTPPTTGLQQVAPVSAPAPQQQLTMQQAVDGGGHAPPAAADQSMHIVQ